MSKLDQLLEEHAEKSRLNMILMGQLVMRLTAGLKAVVTL
jgi:hypothetical protein